VFYVVTQTQGDYNIADIDSDVQAILGRYTSDSPEKRRYLDTMRQTFYYFVHHGKINYSSRILEIQQDVISRNNYSHCDFWISNDIVPHYAMIY
jgi:hypothetical protein